MGNHTISPNSSTVARTVAGADAAALPSRRTPASGSATSARQEADPQSPNETRSFETVAKQVFRRYGHRWKPGTVAVNRSYLRNQILPWFKGRPIADVTTAEVRRWFASLHATPAAANRSLPILSLILRQSEIYGYRAEDSNPCRGLRRYRRRGRERFLTGREIRRLGAVLAAKEGTAPNPVAVIRLLLLTGCRQSEIRTLEWRDYREGHLFLSDSKTGPRTVWLSSVTRKVLDGLPRSARWVFPAPRRCGPMTADSLYGIWRSLREAARVPEVRLHDLRHSYASFALRRGEAVPTIGRLLGHRDPATTLKYIHFADAMAREAVETVGDALDG